MKQPIRIYLVGGVLVSASFAPAAYAQAETTAAPPAEIANQQPAAKNKKNWTLKVNNEQPTSIQLAAQDALLSEIAAELAQQLGVPVQLSSLMQAQHVTADLSDASVEDTVRALAPQAYLDEIINVQAVSTRKLLAVYLNGLNEPTPARHASLKEQAETGLVRGNIAREEEPDNPAEPALQVKVENGYLTIRARRQPVSVVLYEIAQQLGLSIEFQEQTEELVDLDVQSYRLEDVLRQLPVSVQLVRRVNLSQGQSEPLRIILVAQSAN